MRASAAGRLPLRGDEAQLFRTHNALLVRITAKACDAPGAIVEEACQFAWLQLLRSQPERDVAFGWLVVVARRETWRLAASSRREWSAARRADGDDLGPPLERVADPVTVELRLEAREALRAVACLPERQREPMALQLAGYGYREICELTGRSYTNVNKHLTRARARVREARAA